MYAICVCVLTNLQADQKKNGTGLFCNKKQTNQRIDVKCNILTVQPIIQVMLESYHHILVILEKQALFSKTEMRTLEIK